MKQLTNNLLKMNFQGINLDDVSKIEFAFSQTIGGEPLKLAEYPSDSTFLVTDSMIGIEWTQEETQLFQAGKDFYADTRITMSASEYQPATKILKLKMEPTLFKG